MTDVARGASLLDWVTGLVTDPAAQARFTADPRGVLGQAGLADLDPADLHHAMPLVTDSVAARLDAVVDATAPPGLLAGESGLDAVVRQFSALQDRIVPMSVTDHTGHLADVHDLADHLGDADPAPQHDVPPGFDDPPHHGPPDLREAHDLDRRTYDPWSGAHRADPVADHTRPAPAFATGDAAPHGDGEHAQADLDDGAQGPARPGGGDHHLDEDHPQPAHVEAHHDDLDHGDHLDHLDHLDDRDHTDSHHDPGPAFGAS